MKIVCISDTHTYTHNIAIPKGDMLIHAGDLLYEGNLGELRQECDWLATLPHEFKYIVSGNHDEPFKNYQVASGMLREAGFRLLANEAAEARGLTIYGASWMSFFTDGTQPTPKHVVDHYNEIPKWADIVITHAPALGMNDKSLRGNYCGIPELLYRLQSVQPKLHVSGHIHEAAGMMKNDYTTFVNASICDREYGPVNEPIVIEL